MTVHTDKTARDDTCWDQRRFWRDGAIVRVEWRWGTHVMAEGPVAPPHIVQRRDFCQHHGTQICRQRPGTALS